MDINNNAKIVAKDLNWTAKKELCELWKKTPGISKSAFCKQRGLSDATFYRWFEKFWPQPKIQPKPNSKPKFKSKSKKLTTKANWMPVNFPQQNNKQVEPTELVTLELLLPNNVKAKINVSIDKIINLIQELCYAATVIR